MNAQQARNNALQEVYRQIGRCSRYGWDSTTLRSNRLPRHIRKALIEDGYKLTSYRGKDKWGKHLSYRISW